MIIKVEVCDWCGRKIRELGEVEIVKEPPKEALCTSCAEKEFRLRKEEENEKLQN